MNIELINTGSELMLGRVLNTHQQWLCRRLSDLGYLVNRQVAVDDAGPSIEQAVRDALSRADLVITTGGLGPTSDDRTRDLVAALLGRQLCEDPAIVVKLEEFFAVRKRPMPARVKVQALVPDGALVLPNANGTAPGLVMEVNPNPFRSGGAATWLIMLPGPPRELRPMFEESVVPLLRGKLPSPERFVCRTIRTVGMGESLVEDKIDAPLRPLVQTGLDLAYCARTGEVDVRVSARGANAEDLVAKAEDIIRAQLGVYVFGTDEDELEETIIRRLARRRHTLSAAESCTGGRIADRLTNVPGASEVFLAGLVTYNNEAKQRFVGVRAETLATHGAVSEAVAREMAEGCRRVNQTDFAIAVTGIAGPGGGTPEKPVGTVFIALATSESTIVLRQMNPYDRDTFKQVTVRQALDLLRRKLE